MESRRQKRIRKQIKRENTEKKKKKRRKEDDGPWEKGKGREGGGGGRDWPSPVAPGSAALLALIAGGVSLCLPGGALPPPPHALGTSGYVSRTQLLPDFCIPLCKD